MLYFDLQNLYFGPKFLKFSKWPQHFPFFFFFFFFFFSELSQTLNFQKFIFPILPLINFVTCLDIKWSIRVHISLLGACRNGRQLDYSVWLRVIIDFGMEWKFLKISDSLICLSFQLKKDHSKGMNIPSVRGIVFPKLN